MLNEPIPLNRTTKTLYFIMFDLLENNSFDEITVHDICQQAMISRTTFYSYFKDKYELVVFCLQQERNELNLVKGENIKDNISAILSRFREKECIYKNILLAQTNHELNCMLIEQLEKTIRFNLQKGIQNQEKLDVLAVMYSTGYAGTILWWLEKGFPLSEEILTEYLYSSIASHLNEAMEIE